MADVPKRERKFNEEEVALIIKRAAELQQTEPTNQDTSNALSLTEVEQIAGEAGIDPKLIRQAAVRLDQPAYTTRRSPWIGAPTRFVLERVVEGELPVDEFEPLIAELRRTFGDNGDPILLRHSLVWRKQSPRIDVSVVPGGGVTTIRVEQELRDIAIFLLVGLVGGVGAGLSGMLDGFRPQYALLVAASYLLARTIFGRISRRREMQLSDLIDRLEDDVQGVVGMPTRSAK